MCVCLAFFFCGRCAVDCFVVIGCVGVSCVCLFLCCVLMLLLFRFFSGRFCLCVCVCRRCYVAECFFCVLCVMCLFVCLFRSWV